MQINRTQMRDHLGMIYVDGQIGEAVLYDGFACNAMNQDGQLLVIAPSIKGVEKLPEPVGMVDIDLFRKVLGGPGDEEVSIDFVDERIQLDDFQGRARILTAAPNLIGSNVKDETVEKVTENLPEKPKKAEKAPLTEQLVQNVIKTYSWISPEIVTIRIEESSAEVIVGQETGHYFEYDIELESDEPYDLVLSADLVNAVFKQINDYTSASLVVTGPESIVCINQGDYQFIMSTLVKEDE